MPNFLIEIGTEELPLGSLDVIYNELPKKLEASLKTARLSYEGLRIEATPRRIVVFISSLPKGQEDQILEFSGPSIEQAYDGDGKPTRALEGFLKSKGAQIKDLQVKETPRGKFVFVTKHETGKPVQAMIAPLICEAVTSLPFPKLMRWEKSGFRFPRPIRRLVALLDEKVISFTLAGLKAGRQSRGHRFLSPKSFSILKADWLAYLTLLRKNHVILSLEEREVMIAKELAGTHKLDKVDSELLHTVSQLVEEPFLISGGFQKEYLDLPAEVLATCMKKNQKIFACYDSQGKMTHRFVAVLNGKRKGLERVRADFENVLESRLKDARYFYAEDTKQPLEAKLPTLEQIIYLGKLGTMKDKTQRLEKLAQRFCDLSGDGKSKGSLIRAARLCKADLMTHLVYEMPELQGVIGGEYARVSGELKEVAHAIQTQYLPKNLSEDFLLVKREITLIGGMLGLIDRLDLLVGAFGMGLEPTGSQDPFALRRAGGIMIKMIRAFRYRFSLSEMIKENTQLYGSALKISPEELTKKLKAFLQERFLFEIAATPGTRSYEIAQAVFKSSFDDVADAFERYEIMFHMFREETEVFTKAVKILERVSNLLKSGKMEPGQVRSESLKEEMEIKLYQILEQRSVEVKRALEEKKYKEATQAFVRIFSEPVHDFFDKVLVNAEDAEIRRNRYALLKRVHSLYADKLADLSLLSRME